MRPIQRRTVATQAFVPGTNNARFDLPTDNVVLATGIHLSGTFTIATQDCSAVSQDGFLGLLKNLKMDVDGKFQLLPGVDLDPLARVSDKYEQISGNTSDTLAVGQAVYNVNVLAWFHHAMPGLRGTLHAARDSTSLDTRGRQSVTLTMDMQALSAIATPQGSTVLSEALTVDVIQIEDLSPPDINRQVRILEQRFTPVTAAGQMNEDIRDGNMLRSVFEIVRNNSVRSDALVTQMELRIQRGGRMIFPEQRSYGNVQADMEQLTGIAFAVGENWIQLDRDNTSRSVEDLSTTTEARLKPTTIAPTGTANITRLIERVAPAGSLARSG